MATNILLILTVLTTVVSCSTIQNVNNYIGSNRYNECFLDDPTCDGEEEIALIITTSIMLSQKEFNSVLKINKEYQHDHRTVTRDNE